MCLIGIGPMSDDRLSIILDYSRYLTGIAVSGYGAADVDYDGITQYENIPKSNSLTLINIDDERGNMIGKQVT